MSTFLNNKYTRIYYQLVEKARQREYTSGYTETHHIIPRSLGGSDLPDNLVILTAREHFICHRLLTKMTTGKSRSKMIFAVWAFSRSSRNQERYVVNSHAYKKLREDWVKELSKINTSRPRRKMSEEEKIQHRNRLTGMKRSEKTKERMREAWKLRSKDFSKEHRKKISQANSGRKASPDTKQKMSETRKGINPVWTQKEWTCEHCGKTGVGSSNYNRWHGNNCKHKETI